MSAKLLTFGIRGKVLAEHGQRSLLVVTPSGRHIAVSRGEFWRVTEGDSVTLQRVGPYLYKLVEVI